MWPINYIIISTLCTNLTYYNGRVQSYSQTTSDKDSNFVIFDHFDSISRLTSIRLEFEPNFICDPSTTLLYLPCVQISTGYNERVQSSSQTTSDKDSNFVIFDHFDSISRLIQFIFMMDQITYVIHQLHYNIYLVYIFQLTIMNECKVLHKQPPIRTQILSFLTILTVIPD